MKQTWDNYKWDEWVPVEVRQQIVRFWSPSMHRSPQDWQKDAREQGAPAHGAVVTLPTLIGVRGENGKAVYNYVEGRYVHAWNNIGRLVHEDGTFSYVSFHGDDRIWYGKAANE